MPREVDGLLDTIDRLVDESLAVGPVDDYNTNRYDKCWHCDRDWHGIAITERIEQMRWMGRYNETYRVADDDSPVLCPGSDFIGPVQSRTPASRWSSQPGSFHCEVVPVTDRPPRRDLNFGVILDGRPAWLRRMEAQLLALHAADVPGDPFDASTWRNVGYISAEECPNPSPSQAISLRGRRNVSFGFTVERGQSRGFAFDQVLLDEWTHAERDLTASDIQPTSIRSEASSPTPRRRERHQLRTRTQQQAQAAQSRRQLVERMRAAQPHTTREERT